MDSFPAGELQVREAVRIGSRHGSGPAVFGRVLATEVDADGNVYVLDGSSAVVSVFDRRGNHLRDFGGSGEGPGEFRSPNGLVLDAAGRLWVFDWQTQRYTVFGRDGSALGTYRRAFSAGWGTYWNATVDTDGLIHEATSIRDATDGEVEHVFLVLDFEDGVAQAVDTFPQPPGLATRTWRVGGSDAGPGVTEAGGIVSVPYMPERHGRVDPTGGIWVGRTDSLRFARYAEDGTILQRIERSAIPMPIDEEARDRILGELRARFGDRFRPDPADLPANFPLWTDFWIDEDGRLWLQRFAATAGGLSADPLWEIFDPDGELVASVRLPLRTEPRPSVRAGRLVGVVKDELGVDYVVVYELNPA